MKNLIDAHCNVVTAWNIIEEKGLGHQSLINQYLRNARASLAGCPEHGEWHQVGWVMFELAAAINAVTEWKEAEAVQSLEVCEAALELLIEKEPLNAWD